MAPTARPSPPRKRGRPPKSSGRPPGATSARTPVAGRGYVQVALALPRFHLRVLESEGKFIGKRRSEVLEFLVQRKAGILDVNRSASAPKYEPDPKELATSERFIWHCPAEVKKRFDELRMAMGNIGAREWVIFAINEWIGLKAGIWGVGERS